jgi:hypothetical protein
MAKGNNVIAIDIVLRRDTAKVVHFIAYRDRSLALEGPMALPDEAALLATRDAIESSLNDNSNRLTDQELKSFGQRLAKNLFPDGVAPLLTVGEDRRLRIGICSDDTVLKNIPWEYVVFQGGGDAPSMRRTIARIVPTAYGGDGKPVRLKGRALKVCMAVARPASKDYVPYTEVKNRLESAFQENLNKQGLASKVVVDAIDASIQALGDALANKKYDVIHFLGHGAPDLLYFVDDTLKRNPQEVRTEQIVPLFCDPNVQLVILSACSTGKMEKLEGLPSLAERLVENGMPAVVANQMPIFDVSIAPFCTRLYQVLLETGEIDLAVGAGRSALKVELGANKKAAAVEWGMPVLYRRPGRSILFELGGKP